MSYVYKHVCKRCGEHDMITMNEEPVEPGNRGLKFDFATGVWTYLDGRIYPPGDSPFEAEKANEF